MLRHSPGEPDILEVIGDLSSDEVFTPPRVARAALDQLPQEVWSDPDLRWLDPGTKTGVFLREITRRLMIGLAETIADEQERLDHILHDMVFGVAVTELTALMARRTLYCSKDATGPHSVTRMPHPAGNIWFARVEHAYDKVGRCTECSAVKDQMERPGKENHAYGFIHATGREAIEKEIGMKFDVVVGNPPYQMKSDGGTRDVPIYQHFVDQAKALSPRYITLITPSRWMGGGLGLGAFRAETLSDRRITKLVDFYQTEDVFPGSADFEGGVSYFLWDREANGNCEITFHQAGTTVGPETRALDEFDILVRDNRALRIVRKVLAHGEPSITEILSADKEFGMTSNFSGFKTSRVKGDVALHYNRSGKRMVGWMKRSEITKSEHLLDTWKVLTPKAYGERGAVPAMVLGPQQVVAPPSACTQTYLFFFLDTEAEAESVASYLRTRFARFLISVRKITQDATRATYTWVPQQSWDREWTDDALFDKYGFSDVERSYIGEMIREMPT